MMNILERLEFAVKHHFVIDRKLALDLVHYLRKRKRYNASRKEKEKAKKSGLIIKPHFEK